MPLTLRQRNALRVATGNREPKRCATCQRVLARHARNPDCPQCVETCRHRGLRALAKLIVGRGR